ncbi:MAG: SxtJ family membrane protein [bacterium]
MANPVEVIQPDKGQLRTFGLIFAGIIVAIFGVALPLLLDRSTPTWPWIIAITMVGLAVVAPKFLIYIYKPWLKFGAVAGWINTRAILFVMFYGLITPTGLIMRLFGSDPLRKRFEPESGSYRVTNQPQSNDHMEKPY